MTSMLEQVARAICEDGNHTNPDALSMSGEPYWTFFQGHAKAAIVATLKPTPETLAMIEILVEACDEHITIKECAEGILEALQAKALEDG